MENAVAFSNVSLILVEPGPVERMSHGLRQNPGRVVGHLGILINCDDVLYSGKNCYISGDLRETALRSASEQ